jgi:hypothetical protein
MRKIKFIISETTDEQGVMNYQMKIGKPARKKANIKSAAIITTGGATGERGTVGNQATKSTSEI